MRELAEAAGVNAGYVSRVITLLDEQALIERRGRGRIVGVDWPRLLERWAQEAPLTSRGKQTMCLDPRGLAATTSRLSRAELRYAVTGSLAVSGIAPVAAARLLVVYADNADEAVPALELRITERGANVMLIEPEDDSDHRPPACGSSAEPTLVPRDARRKARASRGGQNHRHLLVGLRAGRLSAAKRDAYFSKLTDAEVKAMEKAVRGHLLRRSSGKEHASAKG